VQEIGLLSRSPLLLLLRERQFGRFLLNLAFFSFYLDFFCKFGDGGNGGWHAVVVGDVDVLNDDLYNRYIAIAAAPFRRVIRLIRTRFTTVLTVLRFVIVGHTELRRAARALETSSVVQFAVDDQPLG